MANPKALILGIAAVAGLGLLLADNGKKSIGASSGGAVTCDQLMASYQIGLQVYMNALNAKDMVSANSGIDTMKRSRAAMVQMGCPNPPPDPTPAA